MDEANSASSVAGGRIESGVGCTASALPEAEELEVCCICLDSLCTAPVAALLVDRGRHACCPHYFHAACAERLRPRKCPLCRAAFAAPSAPIVRAQLEKLPPSLVLAGLLRLSRRSRCKKTTVPMERFLELMAAILPVRQASLRAVVASELGTSEGVEVDEAALARLLQHLPGKWSCDRSQALSSGVCSSRSQANVGTATAGNPVAYSFNLWLYRRLRRALLKAAGATGAAIHLSCCGIIVGVVIGLLAAFPRLSWRFLDIEHDIWEDSDWRVALLLCAISIAVQLTWHSIKDPRWIKRGCRWGAVAGAILGWLHALATVDPERHGFKSVFRAGLTGRTAWPESWGAAVFGWQVSAGDSSTQKVHRYDVFEEKIAFATGLAGERQS
eukprot:TRINITY_DN39622_c0_g1_i1.p1 TRINITY_DN39622_c0_g1~~TRINITY_DN39622_c0_g1_i1.p1  ORF type:complete len:386 (-),score=24.64 TRINITY_DN39622_c0_g1_i1:281-1438(-)